VTETRPPDYRYTVISADAHAGSRHPRLPPLPPGRGTLSSTPGATTSITFATCCGDRLPQLGLGPAPGGERRRPGGITAEVLFPNTVPRSSSEGAWWPCPPTSRSPTAAGRDPGPQPDGSRLLRQVRGRRAAWSRSSPTARRRPRRGEVGGSLSHRSASSSSLPPVPASRPLGPGLERCGAWCEELGVVVNIPGGGGIPDHGDAECPGIIAGRAALVLPPLVWHLIFGGIFELIRHCRWCSPQGWPGCRADSRRSTGSTVG